MNLSVESTTHAAKEAGKNFIPYVIGCLIIAFGLIAWDTHFFTRPISWWTAGVITAQPALKTY